MNELQSVTDIDEVIKYAEREAEGCHQTASAFHTDEGVYIHEETRFQYKAILWENIHEWLEELKELRKKQRPHGEWIEHRTCIANLYFASEYECSNCHDDVFQKTEWQFCPNCGADMRVKNELNRVSKELNGEIEKSKSEIVPDYRDGWRLREGGEDMPKSPSQECMKRGEQVRKWIMQGMKEADEWIKENGTNPYADILREKEGDKNG